nr:hypothetical protein [uncultured Desulfovibrio sp.]
MADVPESMTFNQNFKVTPLVGKAIREDAAEAGQTTSEFLRGAAYFWGQLVRECPAVTHLNRPELAELAARPRNARSAAHSPEQQGPGCEPRPLLHLVHKEFSYQPIQVLSAARKDGRKPFFHPPVLKAVEQIEGDGIHVRRLHFNEVRIPDMGSFVIHKAASLCQQFLIAVQRQGRDMDDFSIRASLAAADAYLYTVLVAQNGGQQRQAVENIFLRNHSAPNEKARHEPSFNV